MHTLGLHHQDIARERRIYLPDIVYLILAVFVWSLGQLGGVRLCDRYRGNDKVLSTVSNKLTEL